MQEASGDFWCRR